MSARATNETRAIEEALQARLTAGRSDPATRGAERA